MFCRAKYHTHPAQGLSRSSYKSCITQQPLTFHSISIKFKLVCVRARAYDILLPIYLPESESEGDEDDGEVEMQQDGKAAGGREAWAISEQELELLRTEFLRLMQERFLAGFALVFLLHVCSVDPSIKSGRLENPLLSLLIIIPSYGNGHNGNGHQLSATLLLCCSVPVASRAGSYHHSV